MCVVMFFGRNAHKKKYKLKRGWDLLWEDMFKILDRSSKMAQTNKTYESYDIVK